MWKQLLAYTLAFCMAFEAPATVYAAEQSALTELVNSVTDLTDDTWEEVTLEDSDVEDDDALEETAENETNIVEDETGDGDNDEDKTDHVEDEVVEGDDNDADVSDEQETDALEIAAYVGADKVVPPPGVGDWNVIDPKFAFNSHGMDLVAPLESSNEKIWYSFTAPEDGEYLFYTEKVTLEMTDTEPVDPDLPIGVTVFLYRVENYEQYSLDDFGIGEGESRYLNLLTGNMKKDDVVFLTMYSSNVEKEVNFPLRILKLPGAESSESELPDPNLVEPVWTEDGSSCTVVDTKSDYNNSIIITPKANSTSLTIDVEVTSDGEQPADSEYTIDINYRKSDDIYYKMEANFPVSRFQNYSKTFSVDADSTYIVYYTIRNSEGDVIACFSGKELETLSVKAIYNAVLSDDFTTVTLSADVSNYTGNATRAELHYQYVDAQGRRIEGMNTSSIRNTSDGIHVEYPSTNGAFLAESSYNIKIWLVISQDSLTFDAETVTVETPEAKYSADDVGFSVEDNTEGTGATCTVTVNGAAPTIKSKILYRSQGWPEYERIDYNANSQNCQITSLQPGITYELLLFIGGIKVETTWQDESAADYLSLEKDEDGKNEDGAYDLVRTLKVAVNGDAGLSGTYYLHMTYFTEDLEYYEYGDSGIELNAENEYQVTVYTAQLLSDEWLCPDTDYYVIWTLDQEDRNSFYYGDEAICTLYEQVHTREANILVRSIKSTYDSQTYSITLDADDVVNMKKYGQSLFLYGYFKKSDEDEEDYRRTDSSSYFSNSNDYSSTIWLTDLEEDTSYDLSVRNVGGFVYKTLTFKTPKNEQKIEITSVRSKVTTATIDYSVSGVTLGYWYMYLYLREKGQENWEQKDREYGSPSYYYPFTVSGLTEDTTYEYMVGLGSYSSASIPELELAVTGEFTTQKDQRALSDVEAIVAPSSVVLKAFFSGNIENNTSYIHFFYKIKDEGNWTKATTVADVTSVISQSCSATLTGLARGTEYKYAIVLTDQYDCNDPDSVTKEGWNVTGSFTTASAIAPTKITLSQENLYLNVAYPNVDGFGQKQLKATCTPDTAMQGFVWESSDSTVASVSDGLVRAVGSGTATITVKSIYAEDVYEECEVTVGNYKIGYTTNKSDTPTWRSSRSLYKGESEGNYNLYRMDETGESVVLSPSQFHVDSTNEQVVTWENGVVTAGNVGSAKLIFVASDGEGDNVCAYLPVSVSAQGKGFDILGFDTDYKQYPAIKEDATEDGNAQYTLAYVDDITYTTDIEISPSEIYYAEYFDWKITDQDGNEAAEIATISNGVVTPLKDGKVYLTVTAKKDDTLYYEETRTVVLNFKAIPEQANGTANIYALANISSKIGDVAFPTGSESEASPWEGWSWKYPATPLVTNGINMASYPFEAVYTGEDYYPCETTVNVYITKVTGVSVFDDSSKVVEIGSLSGEGEQADSMTLTVNSIYQGLLSTSAYQNQGQRYEVIIPEKEGIEVKLIEPDGDNESGTYRYQITAEKKGTYTLNPSITVTYTDQNGTEKTKTLAKTTYKIKAVDSAQAASIELTADGVAIEKINDQNGVVIDITDKKASDINPFTLNAVVKDRNDKELDTKLTWKTTDASVAKVQAAGGDTHAAKVTVKGEGHAILMAVAKDDTGCETALRIEIRNHKPRVNSSKVTVNLAYDYDDYYGRILAADSSGTVEITPVYGESIDNVSIYENESISSKFGMYQYSDKWVVRPSSTQTPAKGTYNCTLHVETNTGGTYEYPLKVSVAEKKAKVSAKAANTVNLFYTTEQAWIDLNVSGAYNGIQSVRWQDNSGTDGKGFAYEHYGYSSAQTRLYFSQEGIELTNKNKLADSKVAKGTLIVRFYGYKDAYEIKNVSIKWKYKKPSIVTQSASTTLIPSVEENRNSFRLYNKTDKKYLSSSSNTSTTATYCYYAQVVCKNENVTLSPSSSYVYYDYNGNKSKGSEKITMTLMASYWRESVNATHTMKFVTPTAYLSAPIVTINTTKMGTAYSDIGLKNAYSSYLTCDDIIIEGKDTKSKELLEKDLLEISQYVWDGRRISIKQNRATTLAQTEEGASIKNGTYTYKVTPYYTDSSGNRKALKTLTLKVKATNKAVSAKTKTSGSLNLVNTNTYSSDNYIGLTPVFSNLGSDYTVTGVELCGEYSKYFRLDQNYGSTRLRIANYSELKSGQKYKLAVKYTIRMTDGDTFTITGATFTVKPKQTAPKATISNNNQVIYAAEENASRTYYLYVPDYYNGYRYHISSVSGSLDCNKDGKDDITVTGTTGNYSSTLTVSVTDRDGLKAVSSAKGKTYSIPITVRLQGRDGISKDVKTSIKVTVKR